MARTITGFREMLGLLSRGDFDDRCDEELTKIIEALESLPGDTGKASMTVTIDFKYELGRIDINPTVKVKLPDGAKFMRTPFWTIDGSLSLEHPSQIDMFPRAIKDDTATG